MGRYKPTKAGSKAMRTTKEILNDLRTKPTANVPDTGKILAGKSANASYEAAKNKTLGVDTFWVGGQLRTASLAVLRKLGLEHEAKFTEAGQQADEPPMETATPAIQLAAQPAPARSRKPPAPEPASKPPTRKVAGMRRERQSALAE
jgi:hypothetical protein